MNISGDYEYKGEMEGSSRVSGTPPIYTMTFDDIKHIINENLPVNEEKKNTSGEVFTPFFLIEEMAGRLPASVWKDPTLKWLEPANGFGAFPMVIYFLLMERLPDSYHKDGISYSSKYGKSQHILKNMLYMVELDRENVIKSRKIFGKEANIYHSNFLSMTSTPSFPSLFNVIVGNPPYNEGGTVKGAGILWKDFVFKSMELLAPNGYLLFVHPTGWRKPAGDRPSSGDVWTLFRQYHLAFLKMSDEDIPNFPRVDYYLLHKSPEMSKQKTHVISIFEGNQYEGMLSLHSLDFIPHFVNESVLRILKKVFTKSGDKFDIRRDRSFEPSVKDITYNKGSIPYTFYYEPECRDYVYAYKTRGVVSPDYLNKKKIIITHTRGKHEGELYPVYYPESTEMGSSSNTMYQCIEKGDRVKPLMAFFKSRLAEFIMRITQYSEKPNYKNEYKILNKIAKPTATTKDIYTYYSINKTEIRMIDKILGNPRVPVKSRKLHCQRRNRITKKVR